MPARPASRAVVPDDGFAWARASVRMPPAGPGAKDRAASSSTLLRPGMWNVVTSPIVAITAGIKVVTDECPSARANEVPSAARKRVAASQKRPTVPVFRS